MLKLKKSIFILAILVVLISIIIISIILLNKGEIIYNIDEIGTGQVVEEIDSSLQYVMSRNDYYAVNTCVNKFYNYYMSIFDDEEDDNISKDTCKKYLCNILDKEYINYKDITSENIENKLDTIKQSSIDITKMAVCNKSKYMYLYLVQGRLIEEQSKDCKNFSILVKLDVSNRTFSIYLDDYIQHNLISMEIGQEINILVSDSIEKNENNVYEYKTIDENTYVQDLFLKFKNEMLFDRELTYSILNEEYREKRFGDFLSFENYAKKNIISNVKMKLSKYQKTVYKDYTEYVCIDQDGNYYIFNEYSVMNYNIILDTYTVNLPEYNNKYDSATNQHKVCMNIERVIKAINAKDYKFVYNKLDDTYKKNYFKTIEKFSEFINNNFYEKNIINYLEFKYLGNVYTYSLNIVNSNDPQINNKITIILKLEDNRDFTMSFGV